MSILKLLAFIPLFFLVQTLYGQKKKELPLPPPPVFVDYCAKNTNFSFAARIKKYPFNVSTQVELIAFDGLVKISNDGEFIFVNNPEDVVPLLTLIGEGKADTTGHIGMRESIALTLPQIDTLTGILYNYGVPRITGGKMIFVTNVSGCYRPRNAILFRDRNGRALAFIEICFECDKTKLSDERISLGEMCNKKLEMIRKFFTKAGIRHGTQR